MFACYNKMMASAAAYGDHPRVERVRANQGSPSGRLPVRRVAAATESMNNPIHSIARTLLRTESAWNPKVVAGRAASALLPNTALRAIKRAYYGRLVERFTDDLMETDALLIKRLLSNGDYVVDIGASIGVYTKLFSRLVGPRGRVWSFEPISETFDYLSNNVRRLGLKNVEVVRSAVSDKDGTERMAIPTYRWGADCLYDARIASAPVYDRHSTLQPSWRSEEVPSITLDSFFRGQETPISFIKCDANFHELACLRGALRTLRKAKPAMLIEVQPNPDNPNTTAFQTLALLRDEGYDAYWFDGTILHARCPGQKSQNYFFLTHANLAGLRATGSVDLAPE
jgi:FkbM family methyltransferase